MLEVWGDSGDRGTDLYLVRLELGEAGRLSVGVGKQVLLFIFSFCKF